MKFFLPHASDPDMAEREYQAVKRFVAENNGQLSEKRYRSIAFVRRGKPCTATVGEIEPLNGEMIIAIFG